MRVKKYLSLLLAVLLIITGSVSPAFAAGSGWQQSGSDWYYYENGELQVGWKKINEKWYYFDSSGTMVTGWEQIGGKWYFFNPGGSMVTGWKQISGKWFYFNAGGSMATGWKLVGGQWYYLGADGAMKTGWLHEGAYWYFLKSSGAMATKWQKISNKWFYFDSNGRMQTGWIKYGNDWYYLKSNGEMACNEIIDGYRLDASGRWIKGVRPDEELNRDNILALLDAYDPDGAFIVRNSRDSSLLFWFGGAETIGEGIDDLEGAVHEQCHDYTDYSTGAFYNSITGRYMSDSERIYIGNKKSIQVTMTEVFDSIEMVDSIPEDLRTFRFSTYVNTDESDMASRQHGVYGLLNEFTAYSWGMNNIVKMQPYLEDNDLLTGGITNAYVSYAEFRYYILEYLLYAKENYPDVYKDIIGNESFKTAFVTVEKLFKENVETWRGWQSYLDWYSCEKEYKVLMDKMAEKDFVDMMKVLAE